MNGEENTHVVVAASTLLGDGGVVSASRLAEAVKARWRRGETPDVAAVLAEHPALSRYRSVVLDLACEEYQHRLTQGESLGFEEFSHRFPSMQRSLYFLLEVKGMLEKDPQFRDLAEAATWPEAGQDYLGFMLLAELGRGTFGRVFLASEPALGGRLVALKVAPHGNAEAEIIGKLHHPNIVPIYSIQSDRATGLTAVCMPYLGCTTLCAVLHHAFANCRSPVRASVILDAIQDLGEAGDLKETQSVSRVLSHGAYVDGVIHLVAQLADALAHAHSRGICHRDLKPSNVLLTLDGRPLLLDFNLSSDEQQSVHRIGGTLPYMAPEQLRQLQALATAEPDRVDPRSDVFSLGVILYELLCGRHPFGQLAWNQPFEQVARGLLEQQERGPLPLERQNRQVDKALSRLVRRCLAFNPADRFQSAEDLATALGKNLARLPRARRWSRSHPLQAAGLGATLVIVLLGGMVGLSLRDPASVRELRRGKEACRQEAYGTALEALGNAIRVDPGNVNAYLERVRVHQKVGDWERAIEDLQAVARLAPSGRIAAALGYCSDKAKNTTLAIAYCEQAIRMGYRSPAVLNNLGCCYLRQSRLEESEACLRAAFEGDRNLRATHINLVTYFLCASSTKPVPKEAYFHARMAVELGPPAKEVYSICGRMIFRAVELSHHPSARIAPPSEADYRRGIEYLKAAIAYGEDPATLTDLAQQLTHSPYEKAIRALRSMPKGNKTTPRCEFLVDPLEYHGSITIDRVAKAP